jgi:hypothetical protein
VRAEVQGRISGTRTGHSEEDRASWSMGCRTEDAEQQKMWYPVATIGSSAGGSMDVAV